MQALWAIETLRAGRPELAARLLTFTPEQARQTIGSDWALHAWELETLANLRILQPYQPEPRRLDTREFRAIAYLVRQLRELENAEYSLRPADVLMEMHRIAQRQFSWQRGNSLQDFYRPILVYGQGLAGAYFRETHGLSVSQFALLGFALFAWLANSSAASLPVPGPQLGLSDDEVRAGMALLSIGIDDARPELEKILAATPAAAGWPTAYKPSLLRKRPILAFGEAGQHLVAPIPSLLLHRVTHGLFYDVGSVHRTDPDIR